MSKVTFKMVDGCERGPRVGHGRDSREITEALDKATGSARGQKTRVRRGHGILMGPGDKNVMHHKLKKLKNDSALLFGLLFLAYLDIGGEYFCSLFLSILYVFLLHFFVYFSIFLAFCYP